MSDSSKMPFLPFIRGEKGEKGDPGKDGVNGLNGKNGYSPIKGVDYFDGKDGEKGDPGEKGQDATLPEITDVVKEVIKEVKEKKVINSSDINMDDLRWHGGGLSKVSHDNTLSGSGTGSDPLMVVSSGSPAGNNTDVQFNDNGVFGGSDNLTWDGSQLTIDTNLVIDGSNYTITPRNSGATPGISLNSASVGVTSDNFAHVAYLDTTLLSSGHIYQFPDEDGTLFVGQGNSVSNIIQINNGATLLINDSGDNQPLQLNGVNNTGVATFDTSLINGNRTFQFPNYDGTFAVSVTPPVADGTYTVGIGVTTNGTITVENGIITAIQEAS